MTFTHGDYSAIDAIPEKDEIAQWLFEKSLEYYPNERAYLGLGIINQKKRKYEESIRILSAGIQQFPKNEHIAVCLGISYMNLGQYKDALQCFLPFPESRQSLQYGAACYQAIGDSEKEAAVIHKMGMIRSQ
jgi:tetratricopeptide (TPR) repeat protein